MDHITGVKIFQKLRSHLKIVGFKMVTGSNFHAEDSQTLSPTA